jgi:hypothetical protein
MDKKVEFVFKDNHVHRLTLTPNRITLKLLPDTSPQESKMLEDFSIRAGKDYDSLGLSFSLRGSVEIKDKVIVCKLRDDKHHPDKRYKAISLKKDFKILDFSMGKEL